ncbi:hypothetical protein R5R35_008097 [Gryllus longicercus]|uniref:Receptor ligand binding region domain-containing protein n=1 Tax=Gryllus longicercus TaxID=2509291 RepID=A0AAN9Z479_9ORTH
MVAPAPPPPPSWSRSSPALLLAAAWLVGAWHAAAAGRVVRLAVIAPDDPRHEQSLRRVLPAVDLAVRDVMSSGILPGWDMKVQWRDSNCSSTHGPLAAFDFYNTSSAGSVRAPAWRGRARPPSRFHRRPRAPSVAWGILWGSELQESFRMFMHG